MRESVAQWLQLSGFEPLSFEGAEPALKVLGPDFDGRGDLRHPHARHGRHGAAPAAAVDRPGPAGDPDDRARRRADGGRGDAHRRLRLRREAVRARRGWPSSASAPPRRGRAPLETRALRRELADGSVVMRRLMGASPAIEKLREKILDVAQADGHVLILGETGTGKSLIAHALHACGPRAAKPLVDGELRRVPPEQLEPMLFGGPDWPEKPLIDQAEGGTLCLEDVEALSPPAQARLLERSTPPTRTAPRRAAQHPRRRGLEPPRPGRAAGRGAARRPLLPPRRARSSRRRRCAPAARTS